MSSVPFISDETVAKLLSWDATFRAVETALECVTKDSVAVQNPRTLTTCPKTNTLLVSMPGCLDHPKFGALGCKLVTIAPDNAKLQLPSINANILIFDEVTGLLKAIVAGNEITTWRTAAASAVATKHLKPGKQFEVLAILGAGVQGRIHALAFRHFFGFKEIRIWNRTEQRAQLLVDELNKIYPGEETFKWFESNEDCVRGADVVVTATNAEKPIVQLDWLKPGVHINAVGVTGSHPNELSQAIYLEADIYIDHRSGADAELKSLRQIGVDFKGEIGSVVCGDLPSPSQDQITVFQSLGMAVEDCAMARLIYDLYSKFEE